MISPKPGIMMNPYEFGGPPMPQKPMTSNMPVPQNLIHRIGSPFSDYQRIQPLITNVVV